MRGDPHHRGRCRDVAWRSYGADAGGKQKRQGQQQGHAIDTNADRVPSVLVAVLSRGKNVPGRITLPLPGRDGVAEDPFEERTESKLAVVAVCQQDHASLMALETDHVILRAVAVALFEKCGTERSSGEQSPTQAVRQAN